LGNLNQLMYLCVPRERRIRRLLPNCTVESPRCICSYLNNNVLSDSIPSSLGSLTSLIELCVTPRDGGMDASFCHRAPLLLCHACVRSVLYNNTLSGSIPSSLGYLTSLTYLCVPLAGNKWT
jgi:hypothetical protein